MLHLETIAPETLSLLARIQSLPVFAKTRLVGGTSLALQLGHRISVDLDLFGSWPLDTDLLAVLKTVGKTRKSSGSANGKLQFFFVDGVKVDCVTYDEYPWLDQPVEACGVRLAGIRDIAAMKINAITKGAAGAALARSRTVPVPPPLLLAEALEGRLEAAGACPRRHRAHLRCFAENSVPAQNSVPPFRQTLRV